jgi:trimeric autotransporter adhesin
MFSDILWARQVAALQEAVEDLVQTFAAAVAGASTPSGEPGAHHLHAELAASGTASEAALAALAAAAAAAAAAAVGDAADAASQAAAAALESAVVWRLREADELAKRATAVGAEEWAEDASTAGLDAARWRLRALKALSPCVALDELLSLVRQVPGSSGGSSSTGSVGAESGAGPAAADPAATDESGRAAGVGEGQGAAAAASEGQSAADQALAARLEARRRAAEEWVGRAGAAMRGKEVGFP